MIDEIVAKYKNKVVVIDFWATWCGPCKDALSKMKSLKKELVKQDVMFVYITNGTSPKQLWENQIQAIGGEHYYLNEEQWNSILNSKQYGFEGIPTYLIFDKEGKLKQKMTGFPGSEEMKKMILELIQ